jgi:hypothetical protein
MIRQWIESGAVLPSGAPSAVATAQVGVSAAAAPPPQFRAAVQTEAVADLDGVVAAASGPPAIPRFPVRTRHRDFAAKRKLIGMGSVH